MEKVNLAQKFSLFSEHWSPKIVGQVQDMHVKLVKLQGEFVWHHHEHEDEMFFVVAGRLLIKFHDGDIWLEAGEFLIIPKGVEHLPIAEQEVQVMLFEPTGTLNTGNVQNARTVADLQEL
ncbi:MAG: cupin domain-containing protein [Chloroflexi bacterium]|nr:cupin domain-containing protein [Chloroflexota bacterium]